MILIEKTEVVGLEPAIRGMRNPMNSWDRSDSKFKCGENICEMVDSCNMACDVPGYVVGENDHDLMLRLARGGPVHGKYCRMINVYLDITAPLYWWKEFDTYKVGTVANSCSTMHKIHAKEFVIDDFSHEHLTDNAFKHALRPTIDYLNIYRGLYIEADAERAHNDCHGADPEKREHLITSMKLYWWQMIQLLPSSYNQKRTIMLNYEVLSGIYKERKNHKLDEWREFCKWIETLKLSDVIVRRDKEIL